MVAAVAGIMLKAVDKAVPSSPTGTTDAVTSVLGQMAPFLGMGLMLVAVGTLVAWSMAQSTF